MSGRRILALARVELLRLLHTPSAFTLLIAVPMLQLILFGFAIRPDGAAPIAIAAPSGAIAEQAASRLRHVEGLRIVLVSGKSGAAEAAVRQRQAVIGIELPAPRSFANLTARIRPARIVIDGTAGTLVGAAESRIDAAYWRLIAERAEIGAQPPLVDRLYVDSRHPAWLFLPGLIGVTVMIAAVMLGALSMARERELGTWEALAASPAGRAEVFVGKLLPYVGIGTAQGLLVLAVAVGVFALPSKGAVWTLALVLPLFSAAHVALGFAIAARAATQLSALQGAVGFYLPAMLLSGFLYPFDTLPEWAQLIGHVFPLSHFIAIAHAVLLRGEAANLADIWPIAGFALAAAMAAIGLQRRRLD